MTVLLTRRELLRSASVGFAVAALPLASSCEGGRARLGCSTLPPAGAGRLDGTLRRLLSLAALAPSSHNSQPWRVQVLEPHRLILTADLARRLPAVDPGDRELRLSLGAFLESLVLAAGALGWEAAVAPRERWPQVAEIRLARAAPSGYPVSRLELRRTLRKTLRRDRLDPEMLRLLLGAAGEATFQPRDSAGGRWLAEATLAAFRQQSWRDAAQAELAGWIRFSDEEAQRRCDGLTTATMEIGGLAGWYVRHFYGPSDVTSRSFRERGIQEAAGHVEQGAGFIVIGSRGATGADLLDAGRRYQRMALLFRELGLAGHPMSQALEETPWRDQAAGRLGLTNAPQFIVRVGRVDGCPEPVSARRPVDAFVDPPMSE